MLSISEIFLSIQGESTYAGLPCIFIRLSGCNIRCSYCDTTYAYEEGKKYSVEAILDEMQQYEPVRLVEITGGEPLLQHDVYELISTLRDMDYQILLETNGTIDIKNVPFYVTCIMDIKCPSSGYGDAFLLSNLNEIHRDHDEIKFVLSDENDYKWALEFIRKHDLLEQKILFSCVHGKLEPSSLAEWIRRDRLPIRLQLQLHKYIWHPEKRGV
ncbi:MAG TPA: radical SAM protein [Candidatus Cloacimonadota bacterium]|nr:radical SAM protein [Candidatus Cloacimonadota bacterium]HPT72683.1 radical SAM protein [Candidatus Cloacimonadota bacterium]